MVNKSKLWQYIDYRVRVNLNDTRVMVGNLLSFDKHMNVVLSDADEIRIIKPKDKNDPEREIKRPIGLIVIRGETINSLIADTPPHYLKSGYEPKSQLKGTSEPINRQNLINNSDVLGNNLNNPNGIN